MYKLTYPKEKWNEEKIRKADILELITTHRSKVVPNLKKNMRYYMGDHKIKYRKRDTDVNNKMVCNHAKDIADTATGYFMANALTYSTHDDSMDIDKLTDSFDEADVDEIDHDNGLNMSIYGLSYEYAYAKEGESAPTSKNISPENAFLVYDDTIEENELFGVYYYRIKDDVAKKIKYVATVMTENYIYTFDVYKGMDHLSTSENDRVDHYFGAVPLIVYQNNKYCIGDFEQQIGLIDAYDYLMSDRLNDKEQFLDALLVIYGSILGDDEKETSEAMKKLQADKLLELSADAKAEYLTRTFDEVGVETLRNAIKEDIYTFSHVPNLTDENFVGNSSGVAMEYKLLGLEMITKTKTRYYIKGLKKRFTLYCNYLGMRNIAINPSAISVNFTRGLPKNLLEISQMIANLKGIVSQDTLLNQIPFVEDPEGEIKAVEEENRKAVDNQQRIFAGNENTPPDEVDE